MAASRGELVMQHGVTCRHSSDFVEHTRWQKWIVHRRVKQGGDGDAIEILKGAGSRVVVIRPAESVNWGGEDVIKLPKAPGGLEACAVDREVGVDGESLSRLPLQSLYEVPDVDARESLLEVS
jgi:hypothetical protein